MSKCLISLVTGGASGLGKATVERMVQQGGKVVLCDLPDSNGKAVAEEFGSNVIFAPADVRSEKDINEVVKLTKEKFGKLNTVVNCAGIAIGFQTYNFNKNTAHRPEDFERVLMVNLFGTFNVVRLTVGLIGQNEPDADGHRGVIINTSCISAFNGQIGQVAYAASKAGVAGMTLPLARDLATQGIRVNCIAPGLFDTPILSYLPEKVRAFLSKSTVFPKRFGHPSEFAQMVTSIVENSYINGENIRLDAGLRMSL